MKSKILTVIGLNAIIVVCMIISILYTLTYKEVPVQSQHLWYATSLENYLFWTHLELTIVMVLCCIAATVTSILIYVAAKKESKK